MNVYNCGVLMVFLINKIQGIVTVKGHSISPTVRVGMAKVRGHSIHSTERVGNVKVRGHSVS